MQVTAAILTAVMPLSSFSITHRHKDAFLLYVDTALSSLRMFPLVFSLHMPGHYQQEITPHWKDGFAGSEMAVFRRQHALFLTAKPFFSMWKRQQNEPLCLPRGFA